MGKKKCARCGEYKPIDEFSNNDSYCKDPCRKQYNKEYSLKNIKRLAPIRKRNYKIWKEKNKQPGVYKITFIDLNRDEYFYMGKTVDVYGRKSTHKSHLKNGFLKVLGKVKEDDYQHPNSRFQGKFNEVAKELGLEEAHKRIKFEVIVRYPRDLDKKELKNNLRISEEHILENELVELYRENKLCFLLNIDYVRKAYWNRVEIPNMIDIPRELLQELLKQALESMSNEEEKLSIPINIYKKRRS